jgi:hypothetical protein
MPLLLLTPHLSSLFQKVSHFHFFVASACFSCANTNLKQPFCSVESPTCQQLKPYGSPMFPPSPILSLCSLYIPEIPAENGYHACQGVEMG